MNKKILFFSLLLIAISGVVFKTLNSKDSEVEKLRKQHAEFLKNHPYQKTGELPKKERKAQGLPPNAYFEQKYLSEINPNTGKTHKENVFKLREQLSKLRAGQKVPGEATNPWIERGPDNVGGRTRALLFDPNDATNETVFAGGVSGGLWKNTKISDPANKWVRIGIPENLSVSCIAVDPNDSKTFYVGTGESYVNGDVNGDGLWKSTDGGNSWTNVFGGVSGATYLDANSTVTVNSPASIAGVYISTLATAFGGDLSAPVTADLVLVEDDTAPTSDACSDLVNGAAINGKIAIIRRGSCNFDEKVKRAETAGAIAVVMVNNVDGNPIAMGGDDTTITIPAVMTPKTDGEAMINALTSGAVNVTLTKGKDNATNALIVPGVHHINDVIVRNNGGTSEVYVAAGESGYTGGAAIGADSFGLYKSTDGTNFAKVNVPKTSTGSDYEPNNLELGSDNSIYLSTIQSFAYGNGGGAIFKSTDGTNFSLKHTVTDGNRTEIATSPTNPGVVYILAQTSTSGSPVKMFKTSNDFASVNDLALPNDADNGIPANDFTRGQAFYDLLLKVDPNNEDVVYVGGIDLFKSTNGGTTWDQISKWSNNNNLAVLSVSVVHADQHGLAFASSSKMVFGNDGGVYYTNNSGGTIDARNNNYNTLQFYTLGVAPTTAFGGDEYFVAGAQDNGTQLVEKASAGINSSIRAAGGDGAASFFDTDGTDKYFISNYVYNQSIVLHKVDPNVNITINSEGSSNGDFINQEELDSNLNILYSNYTSDLGNTIRRYSDLLSIIIKTNLTDALMNSEPSALKVSPYTTTASNLFVGLKNGKLLKVKNANIGTGEWSEITGPNFVGSVSDIEFGENENEIFVTMHNYGVTSIWFTNDGGTNWLNKEGNLPDIPVKSILQNPVTTNEVIIGTVLGVWKTKNFNAAAPTWTQSYNGMSYVPVLDLDLRDDNTVFAATYGRGVFSGKFVSDPNGDDDGDGVLNGVDNCPSTSNADQKDTDGNGVGDVCQDTDGDGIMDNVDNCVSIANADQADADGNGIGDACQDTDGDGVKDNVDNCPTVANADQKDTDGNGVGDACQDTDGDGILDINDNCPTVANADQKDTDGNGVGDVCQDTDGDGVIDDVDNCPTNSNADQKDTDGNGVGDACQDTDGDGVMDDVDNCINTKNAGQEDGNNDGVGDVCDTSYLNPDNISIETISETCVDQNDGKITVNVKQTFVSYTVTIKGDGKDETKALTGTSLTFENLKPASYEVCVKIDGKNYTQCFEINIIKASTVALKVAKNQQSRDYTFSISSGTAPYNVYLNGNLINTYNVSTFNVKVQGSGVLEVKTAKSCEGVFKTSINNIFLRENPVTDFIKLILPSDSASNLDVLIYDVTGKTVINKKIEKQGNELSIPFSNFKSGIYILKIGADKTNTFKILK
ncbi:thrombospondin type 3 repeat-containing protein [uncultured Tenacibaculum sp.]|uniref:thrombospondin type 3 repeat-containing protein n=1 Tax=uncultured Tenacibaculum sp. TaxID=174713 RepID=UPI002638877F|nr:thrombospondin type 3 repeat-containing protein [uncultured Tenacibaculum sp.]